MDNYAFVEHEDLQFRILYLKTMETVGGPIETIQYADAICKWLNDLTKKENE